MPIQSYLYTSKNILTYDAAIQKIAELKASGKTVGLCSGGFDLLHPGHMKHFESAKELCDVLFVALTSDRFVSSRKGSGRPVYPDTLRAYAAASLKYVDFAFVADYAKSVDIIKHLKPSFYIKGPDYINKTTPGITAEREAIASVGGEMKYTDDEIMSTTGIIDYIKNQLDVKEVLVIIDRDGTLITNDHFPGKNTAWKEEIKLNDPVASFLSYLQTKYKTTKIVVSNQAGVARRYFDCSRVEEINKHVHEILAKKGIKIDNWQYCPDMDATYAEAKKNEFDIDFSYVKDKTRRKPSPEMVLDGLKEVKRELDTFSDVLVIGNSDDDQKLAENLKAKYVDVTGKSYEELVKQFS